MFKYLVIAIVLIVAFVLVRRLLARRPIEPVGKQPPKVITIDGDAVVGGDDTEPESDDR